MKSSEITNRQKALMDQVINRWKNTTMDLHNKVYRYKGNLYLHVDEIQDKNPETRAWDVKVLYQDHLGKKYTRDINEFYDRFKGVSDAELDQWTHLINQHVV